MKVCLVAEGMLWFGWELSCSHVRSHACIIHGITDVALIDEKKYSMSTHFELHALLAPWYTS